VVNRAVSTEDRLQIWSAKANVCDSLMITSPSAARPHHDHVIYMLFCHVPVPGSAGCADIGRSSVETALSFPRTQRRSCHRRSIDLTWVRSNMAMSGVK
jgi:hypothetical protein